MQGNPTKSEAATAPQCRENSKNLLLFHCTLDGEQFNFAVRVFSTGWSLLYGITSVAVLKGDPAAEGKFLNGEAAVLTADATGLYAAEGSAAGAHNG